MGRFTLRLPDTLHHALEERAQQEGVSLNQYLVYALTRSVTPAYTVQVAPNTELQQQDERFRALLAELGQPDRTVAQEYLNSRAVETPEDAETAALVARFAAKFPVVA